MEVESARVKAFCYLLEMLRRDYLAWLRRRERDKEGRLNKLVMDSVKFGVVEGGRLKSMGMDVVKGVGHFDLGAKGLLFLRPPTGKMFLPVLGLKSKLEDHGLGVEMALFTLDENVLAAVGFRFETPERKGEKHVYHHAQMIRRFEKSCEYELPNLPPWFPDSLPAFPLSARTPFSLFLAILISLYGLDHILHEWRGHSALEPLKAELVELKNGCGHC